MHAASQRRLLAVAVAAGTELNGEAFKVGLGLLSSPNCLSELLRSSGREENAQNYTQHAYLHLHSKHHAVSLFLVAPLPLFPLAMSILCQGGLLKSLPRIKSHYDRIRPYI